MFNKENRSKDEGETIIGPSVQVEGNFTGNGNVMVEGIVSGTLKTNGDLKIGPEAKIKADVEAKNIYTSGEIRGNQIIAHEKIEMAKTSKITGNIKATIISMEAGAVINGKVNMSADSSIPDEKLELIDNKKDKRNNKNN